MRRHDQQWQQPIAQQSPQQQPIVISHAPTAAPAYIPEKKSAGWAAVLSFFYVGLGQIYNGEIFQGLMMMFVPPLGVATWCFFGYQDGPLVSSRAARVESSSIPKRA